MKARDEVPSCDAEPVAVGLVRVEVGSGVCRLVCGGMRSQD